LAGIRPARFEPVPSWCTGGSVESSSRVVRIRPPLDLGSTVFVFSSVLRESTPMSFTGRGGRSTQRPARASSSTAAAPAPKIGRASWWSHRFVPMRLAGAVRRPLRTAEQARASLFFQATKSQRWMPWRQEPMKDVSDCEKLRGAVYWALIRRCPNGETQHSSWSVTPV
jgi:hypothetical protein